MQKQTLPCSSYDEVPSLDNTATLPSSPNLEHHLDHHTSRSTAESPTMDTLPPANRHISLNALIGNSSSETLHLAGTVNNTDLTILIDGDSTHLYRID